MPVFLRRPHDAMKDGNTVLIRRRFDQDAGITTRDRQFFTYEWLGHSFRNIEIVGVALVVSLPLCQILFAVTFHLDPSQEFIATNLRDSLYLIRKRERIAVMHCAACRRDMPSVQQREEFCPAFLCDDCYEYENTRQMFKLNSDLAESQRLYNKLMDLSKRIDELRREDERQGRQKRSNPLFNKDS